MSTLKVNQIEPRVGGDVTIGESGGTVTLADGATAVGFGGGGKVLQVVPFTDNTDFSSATGSYADTGKSFDITLSDAANKVALMFQFELGGYNKSAWNTPIPLNVAIYRGGSLVASAENNHIRQGVSGGVRMDWFGNASINYLDSPGAAGLNTYNIYVNFDNVAGPKTLYKVQGFAMEVAS